MPRFSKYSGAGNDFVIVRAEEVGLRDAGLLARAICPRASGVGVDGLILVRSVSDDLVRLRFFNPDGSEFATCGNGSRCAARYAVDRGLAGQDLTLVTDDGDIVARVGEAEVELRYSLDARVVGSITPDLQGVSGVAWHVRMGTPHLVVPVDDIEIDDFAAFCRPLRSHPALGPEGANVDLVSLSGPPFRIRTFERGVEGETQACGSGCMSAALAMRESGRIHDGPVDLLTRSGAILRVAFVPDGGISLGGPSHYVFDGVFPEWS